MVKATIEAINMEIKKYQALAEGFGDTKILNNGTTKRLNVYSNYLVFQEDYVYLYLKYHQNVKKIKAYFCLTNIDEEYVESLLSRVGLPTTEQNIQNYARDPSMIAKFWNDRFIKQYNEIFKYLRKTKIKYLFKEKFAPMLNKNRFNEVVF